MGFIYEYWSVCLPPKRAKKLRVFNPMRFLSSFWKCGRDLKDRSESVYTIHFRFRVSSHTIGALPRNTSPAQKDQLLRTGAEGKHL
jgi:hypothetical protein